MKNLLNDVTFYLETENEAVLKVINYHPLTILSFNFENSREYTREYYECDLYSGTIKRKCIEITRSIPARFFN